MCVCVCVWESMCTCVCLPGGGAGVAAAVCGGGGGFRGGPVGGIKLCIAIGCGDPSRFEHREASDVAATATGDSRDIRDGSRDKSMV